MRDAQWYRDHLSLFFLSRSRWRNLRRWHLRDYNHRQHPARYQWWDHERTNSAHSMGGRRAWVLGSFRRTFTPCGSYFQWGYSEVPLAILGVPWDWPWVPRKCVARLPPCRPSSEPRRDPSGSSASGCPWIFPTKQRREEHTYYKPRLLSKGYYLYPILYCLLLTACYPINLSCSLAVNITLSCLGRPTLFSRKKSLVSKK